MIDPRPEIVPDGVWHIRPASERSDVLWFAAGTLSITEEAASKMEIDAFSMRSAVKNLPAAKAFYEHTHA